MKFATKLIQYYPPHLRHVATLPWKIKKSTFSRYSVYMPRLLYIQYTAVELEVCLIKSSWVEWSVLFWPSMYICDSEMVLLWSWSVCVRLSLAGSQTSMNVDSFHTPEWNDLVKVCTASMWLLAECAHTWDYRVCFYFVKFYLSEVEVLEGFPWIYSSSLTCKSLGIWITILTKLDAFNFLTYGIFTTNLRRS